MAVVGGAEFELVPILAANFRAQATQLINTALRNLKVTGPNLTDIFNVTGEGARKLDSNVSKLAEKLAHKFGVTFTKKVKDELGNDIEVPISISTAIDDQLDETKDALLQNLTGLARQVQSETVRAVVAAETAINSFNNKVVAQASKFKGNLTQFFSGRVLSQSGLPLTLAETQRQLNTIARVRLALPAADMARLAKEAANAAAKLKLTETASKKVIASSAATQPNRPVIPLGPVSTVVSQAQKQLAAPIKVRVDVRTLNQDLAKAAVAIRQLQAANKDKVIEIRAKILVDPDTADKEIRNATAKLEKLAAQTGAKIVDKIDTAPSGRRTSRGGLGGFIDDIQARFVKFSESITGRAGGLAQLLGAGLSGSVFVVAARLVRQALQAIVKTVIAAIAEFGKLEDALNAVKLIFGRASADVEAFARSTSRVSLSVTQALKVVQEFGTALLGVGLSNQALGDTSILLAQIAEDLSSVSGIPVEDVAGKIAQGIQGDVRSLRALRINIRESDITNRAFADGLQLTGFELGEAGKLAAFLPLFFERVAFAQNDATNTAGSLNNSLANLKKSASDFLAAVGEELGPAIADWATSMAQVIRLITEGLPEIIAFTKEMLQLTKSGRLLVEILVLLRGKYREHADAIHEAAEAQRANSLALEESVKFAAQDAARVERNNQLVNEQFDVLTRLVQAERADAQAKLAVQQAALSVTQAEHALEDARIAMERQTFVIAQAENALAQARIQQRLVLLRAVAAEQFESRATIALKNAKLDLFDANQALADLADPLTRQEREVDIRLKLVQATFAEEKAQLNLTKAMLDQADASLDIFDATEKLIQLRRRGVASAADIARAELAVRKANLQFQASNIEVREVKATSPLEQEKLRIDTIRARQDLERLDVTLANEIERARLALAGAIIAVQEAEIGLEASVLEEVAATQAVISAEHGVEDAIRARLSLQDAYMAAELALTGAKRGLFDAINDAKFAQIEFDDAIATAANKVITQAQKFDEFNSHLQTMARLFGVDIPDSINFKLAPAIASIPRILQRAFEAIEQRPTGGQVTITIDDKAGAARALGGSVLARFPYLVGEKGPELFIPDIAGRILPNNLLSTFNPFDLVKPPGKATGDKATQRAFNQTNHIYSTVVDPEVVANEIARKVLAKAL